MVALMAKFVSLSQTGPARPFSGYSDGSLTCPRPKRILNSLGRLVPIDRAVTGTNAEPGVFIRLMLARMHIGRIGGALHCNRRDRDGSGIIKLMSTL
jgi:hypothetical protein